MVTPDQLEVIARLGRGLGALDQGDGRTTPVPASPIAVQQDGETIGWLYDEVGEGDWYFSTDGPS